MKSRIAAIVCWLAFSLPVGAQPNLPPVRLAVVCFGKSAQLAGDLITPELSRHPDTQLLERSEIDKVLREQAISAENRNVLKAGELLGADGLLVIEDIEMGTNLFVQLRLVAVKPGVVIDSMREHWPVEKATNWPAQVRAHLAPLLPKLVVRAGDAVPISVVNFRSAVRGGAEQSLERDLTVMTIHRLAREHEVFVLERQHLGEVVFEKDLNPADESPFWTGRYLIDGTLDKDGFDPDRVTISARLSSPRGGTITTIEFNGPRSNVTVLTETLVAKVLASLQKTSAVKDWHPLDEAAQYYTDGEWALRWGLKDEARTAAETAWALGERDSRTALLRMRCEIDYSAPFFWENSTMGVNYPRMPDASKLGPTIRALELLCENGPPFIVTNGVADKAWVQGGSEALDAATDLLGRYHNAVESRESAGEQLAQLRAMARKAIAVIPRDQWTSLLRRGFTWWSRDGSGGTTSGYELNDLIWSRGGFWYEKPEDAIPVYREVVMNDGGGHNLPTFQAWTWEDRRRIPALKKQFCDMLCRSTSEVERLEGRLLKASLEPVGPNGQLVQRVQEWADELWNQRQQFYDRPRSGYRERALSPMQTLLSDKAEHDPSHSRAPLDAFTQSVNRLRDDFVLNQQKFTRFGFWALFPNGTTNTFTSDNAQHFLPLLNQLSKKHQLSGEDERAVRNVCQELTATTAKPAAPTPSPQEAAAKSQVAPPVVPVDFTLLQLTGPHGEQDDGMNLRCAVFRAGRLWFVAIRHSIFAPNPKPGAEAALVGIDLATGGMETIWVPDEYGVPYPSVEVTGDSLYCTSHNKLLRYHLREKQWEATDAPIDNGAHIAAFNDKVYLGTTVSLLQYDPTTRVLKILASARRRPAENELDNLGWHFQRGATMAEVFPAPHGGVGLAVDQRMFTYTPNDASWKETILPVFCGGWGMLPIIENGRVLLSVTGNLTRARLLEFDPARGTFEELVEHRFPADIRDPRADRVLGAPRWRWPKTAGLHGSFPAADKDGIWVFSPHQWWQKNPNPRDIGLLRFEPEFREPLVLTIQPTYEGRPYPMFDDQFARYLSVLSVPQGILVAYIGSESIGGPIGYWLIPHSVLDAKLAPARRLAQSRAAVEKAWNDALLAKFDANHNGILDPAELALAHLDAGCLEHDREDIDQDDDCVLELEELPYFDVNRDGIFDQQEYATIRLFQTVLAKRAMEKFDANHDGKLDETEWQAFLGGRPPDGPFKDGGTTYGTMVTANGRLEAYDRNKDGVLDLEEVTSFIQAHFRSLNLSSVGYSFAPDVKQDAKP